MSKNRELYRLSNQENVPLMQSAAFLDCVAPDLWDVLLLQENNQWYAAMPYVMVGTFIQTPPFTQHLGPYILPQKRDLLINRDMHRVLEEFVDALPLFKFYEQRWHHSFVNAMPFYLKGFKTSVRYTYQISHRDSIETIFDRFSTNVKRNIKKAQGLVNAVHSNDFERIKTLIELTYKRKQQRSNINYKILSTLFQTFYSTNRATILIASDEHGNDHAGMLLLMDKYSMYYMIGGIEPNYKNSGAMSLLFWEAIQIAHNKQLTFDFEGSMNPDIERFFRSFGGLATPYYSITKSNSWIETIKHALRSWKNDPLRVQSSDHE